MKQFVAKHCTTRHSLRGALANVAAISFQSLFMFLRQRLSKGRGVPESNQFLAVLFHPASFWKPSRTVSATAVFPTSNALNQRILHHLLSHFEVHRHPVLHRGMEELLIRRVVLLKAVALAQQHKQCNDLR